jgi:hypothetical protein
MNKIEIITLKLLGLGTTILYGWSALWISLMYLYGGLYYPIRELGLEESIYFEVFVFVFSLATIGLIIFKIKGRTFFKLLIQDIGLVIISVPFFGLITGYFDNGFDSPDSLPFVYTAIFTLTILTININDWVKTKKPAANKMHVP